MIRVALQLFIISAPLALFGWWVTGPVHSYLSQGKTFEMIAALVGGLAVLALLMALLLKFWLLPSWAGALSERLYAGSYSPDDDAFATLALTIERNKSAERLPELERLALADPRRVRAWLDLARLTEVVAAAPERAVDHLLHGAGAVKNHEDAAMLIWRAVTLCDKHPSLAGRAPELCRRITELYPATHYGRLAASRLR